MTIALVHTGDNSNIDNSSYSYWRPSLYEVCHSLDPETCLQLYQTRLSSIAVRAGSCLTKAEPHRDWRSVIRSF